MHDVNAVGAPLRAFDLRHSFSTSMKFCIFLTIVCTTLQVGLALQDVLPAEPCNPILDLNCVQKNHMSNVKTDPERIWKNPIWGPASNASRIATYCTSFDFGCLLQAVGLVSLGLILCSFACSPTPNLGKDFQRPANADIGPGSRGLQALRVAMQDLDKLFVKKRPLDSIPEGFEGEHELLTSRTTYLPAPPPRNGRKPLRNPSAIPFPASPGSATDMLDMQSLPRKAPRWVGMEDPKPKDDINKACDARGTVTVSPHLVGIAEKASRSRKPQTPPGSPPKQLSMTTWGGSLPKEHIWEALGPTCRPCYTEKRGWIGEDFSRHGDNIAIVADGVGSYGDHGLDASLAAEHYSCYAFHTMKHDHVTPSEAVIAAHDRMETLKARNEEALLHASDWTVQGATTLLIYQLEGNKLKFYELGDGGFIIFRPGLGIIFRTQYARFASSDGQATYQIGPHSPCEPEHGQMGEFQLKQGDSIISGSDGLFDNILEDQVLRCVNDINNKVKQANENNDLRTNEQLADLHCDSLYHKLKNCVQKNVHDQHLQEVFHGHRRGVFKGADDVTILVSLVAE